ncbi:delta-60 repeat domain-containing protein [uncultured Jatrophihabitans sp.]|uniref:delta-60 repeat domain-containing protein n=1 Tax=uncultured Jatrophihabitans sp. TaxID=1610747 RepID=UPI0035CC3B38
MLVARTTTTVTINRLTAAGAVDKRFGYRGSIRLPSDDLEDFVRLASGKFVTVASTSETSLQVTRFSAAGRLDASYGKRGSVQITQGPNGTSVAVAGNGAIAQLDNGSPGTSLTASRITEYSPSGHPAASVTLAGAAYLNVYGLMASPNGGAWYVTADNGGGTQRLFRYTTNLAFDRSFGKHGSISLGNAQLSLVTKNALFLAGSAPTHPKSFACTTAAVTKLHLNGSVDTTFGSHGTAQRFMFAGGRHAPGFATQIALTAHNRIVVLGNFSRGKASQFGLARLHADGSVDHSFRSNSLAVGEQNWGRGLVSLSAVGAGTIYVSGQTFAGRGFVIACRSK